MSGRRIRSFGLVYLVLATLFGCAPAELPRPAEPDPLAGFHDALSELLPPLQEAYFVPGTAVGVIRDGEVLLKSGYGSADLDTGLPVESGTAFNIGSISKTVAAWGVMKLVEAGKIDLDVPVSTYLTRWQLPESEFDHDGVTMRRLLSHTAGLSLHGYPGFHPDDPLPSVEESLSGATNGAGAVYVAHEPGSKWQYSGGGYTLAHLIVEEVTGQPFAPADDYGLGFDIEERGGLVFVGHGGTNEGWMARLKVVPESGDGIVVMTNGSNAGPILEAVVCEWQARVLGDVCDRKPELPIEVDESVLVRTEGHYQVPDGPVLEFRVVHGRLFVYFPDGFRAAALARSETEFFLGFSRASFEFEIDEEGKATSMLFREGNQPEKRAPRIGDPIADG